MAMITVRNLPDEVHRTLRLRAASRGHSMEEEARQILQEAVTAGRAVRLGTALAEIGAEAALSDAEFELFSGVRDPSPARQIDFE